MQHLEVSCAVRRFLKTLGFKGNGQDYSTILLVLVFSPWAGLGREQCSVRRLVLLWYAATWASS